MRIVDAAKMAPAARKCGGIGNAGERCAERKRGVKGTGVKAEAGAFDVEADSGPAALKVVSAATVAKVVSFDDDPVAARVRGAPSSVAIGRKTMRMMTRTKTRKRIGTAAVTSGVKCVGTSGAVETPPWTREIMPAA
jgi:hypothetical protein